MKAVLSNVRSRFRFPVQSPYKALSIFLVFFFACGGGSVAAMRNMEREITEGPNRPLEAVARSGDSWLLQKGATNLVDDSFVPRDLVTELKSQGYQATGFSRSYRAVTLPSGQLRQAIVLDVPARVLEGAQGVVVDQTFGLDLNDHIYIAGQKFTVTGLTKGTSSLGKEGVFLSPTQFTKLGGDTNTYTGIFVKQGHPEGSLAAQYAVFSAGEFEEVNLEYWLTNGGSLPLMVAALLAVGVLLIVLAVLFLGLVLTRRSLIQLRMVGMSIGQIVVLEVIYLLVLWAISLAVQYFVYYLLVSLFRSTTFGYLGPMGLLEFSEGAGAMMFVVLVYLGGVTLFARLRLRTQQLTMALAS